MALPQLGERVRVKADAFGGALAHHNGRTGIVVGYNAEADADEVKVFTDRPSAYVYYRADQLESAEGEREVALVSVEFFLDDYQGIERVARVRGTRPEDLIREAALAVVASTR